ncbi:tRNA-guanine transglycosylase DpdA [Marinobacterium stanieri]|uniref:tRNA-guanine transglycosylase DpdA n=1 Tax=Marinobacterium stanieri TaxID=49186 RepID=UPI003A944ED3
MSSVKFFFPDSHDYVDPSFDFIAEKGNQHRIRQRDDYYPHEIFSARPYDGMLVSKAIVDGTEKGSSKYTVAQRQRFFRQGVKRFLRLPHDVPVMGDCGAFSYASEYLPPYTVEEVAEFYETCGFDFGISVDHIIFAFEAAGRDAQKIQGDELVECKRRKQLTLELADNFLKKSNSCRFTPLGVAHGWNPESMADSVAALQKMGYDRITLGGMVPLKTPDIMRCLEAVNQVRKTNTQFHLLGISRVEHVEAYQRYGVSSFDSTSPLQQAFKDSKNNYHTLGGLNYVAIRVPQVDGNPALMRAIKSGKVDQNKAKILEKKCLETLRLYEKREVGITETLSILRDYEVITGIVENKKSLIPQYERTLSDRPWESCSCDICQKIGIEVVLFRGAERNRRRGFHNIFVLHEKLKKNLGLKITQEASA